MISFERWKRIYQLSKRAFSGHKKSIFFLTFLGLFNGVISGIGINTLIPLFSFITGDANNFGVDFISKFVRTLFEFLNFEFSLRNLLIFVCLLFIIQSLVLLSSNYFIAFITADYERKKRDYLFSKTIKADWSYLLKQRIGHLETVITNDIKYGTTILNSVSGAIIAATSLVIYIAVAVNISLVITVFTFIFGIFYIFLTRPLLVRTKRLGMKNSLMYKEVANFINENIKGMKTIKSYSVEDKITEIAKWKFLSLRNYRVGVALFGSIGSAIVQPLTILFIGGVFTVLYKSPNFNVGAFLAMVYLIQKIFAYFSELQRILQKSLEAAPYMQSVLAYEDKAKEFLEKTGGEVTFKFSDSLKFENVHFAYNKNNKILQGVDFELIRGNTIGIVGPSGGGKTTIVDLILRLFNPTSGQITLDGVNVEEININEWRNKIGYVSQDLFLLNDTIENNIRFYNSDLSIKDIEEASKMANIYDFVMSTPEGFKTGVGEGGNLLSVGQRQRVVIARVLARKPEILILDEATSALDNQAEQIINSVINGLKGKISIIVIAHRLSTVMDCDNLIVLEDGRVIETGQPSALLRDKKSNFHKLNNLN